MVGRGVGGFKAGNTEGLLGFSCGSGVAEETWKERTFAREWQGQEQGNKNRMRQSKGTVLTEKVRNSVILGSFSTEIQYFCLGGAIKGEVSEWERRGENGHCPPPSQMNVLRHTPLRTVYNFTGCIAPKIQRDKYCCHKYPVKNRL